MAQYKTKIGVYREHDKVAIHNTEPSMTRQEFADESDVNNIMKKFQKTGILPANVTQQPQYLDLTKVPDLQTAMNVKIQADKAFMTLPAKVRREFDNDPVKFVEFATDKDNLPKLREWGLAAPEKAPDPPLKVEVTNQPEAGKKRPTGSKTETGDND